VVTLNRRGRCDEARLCFLSVGEGPVMATGAAAALRKEKPTAEAVSAAAEIAATEDIDPTSDIHASEAYRRHLARVLAAEVLTTATERARSR
jgi:CO/xanthine dehydrogenase FAD-binding subunit